MKTWVSHLIQSFFPHHPWPQLSADLMGKMGGSDTICSFKLLVPWCPLWLWVPPAWGRGKVQSYFTGTVVICVADCPNAGSSETPWLSVHREINLLYIIWWIYCSPNPGPTPGVHPKVYLPPSPIHQLFGPVFPSDVGNKGTTWTLSFRGPHSHPLLSAALPPGEKAPDPWGRSHLALKQPF